MFKVAWTDNNTSKLRHTYSLFHGLASHCRLCASASSTDHSTSSMHIHRYIESLSGNSPIFGDDMSTNLDIV